MVFAIRPGDLPCFDIEHDIQTKKRWGSTFSSKMYPLDPVHREHPCSDTASERYVR